MDDKTYRLRRVVVTEEEVCALFLDHSYGGCAHFDGVPPGYEVVSVHHSPERRAFVFTVRHGSFAIVPRGQFIPEAPRASPKPTYAEAFVGVLGQRVMTYELPEYRVHSVATSLTSTPRDYVEAMERHKRVLRLFFPDVPEDARVLSVTHEPRSHVYYYRVTHPSFDVIPAGTEVPLRRT